MGYENDPSSTNSGEEVSRRIAAIGRLGGHMRLRPETRSDSSRFRIIAAARAAKLSYGDRSQQSSNTHREEHVGLEGSSTIEPLQSYIVDFGPQPEMPSSEASRGEI